MSPMIALVCLMFIAAIATAFVPCLVGVVVAFGFVLVTYVLVQGFNQVVSGLQSLDQRAAGDDSPG